MSPTGSDTRHAGSIDDSLDHPISAREPDSGEINYQYLCRPIDELGCDGWVSGEYRPRGKVSDGLSWARPWLSYRIER